MAGVLAELDPGVWPKSGTRGPGCWNRIQRNL